MIDHAARLDKARQRMDANNIGLMFLPPGANLFYLTAVRRPESHNTDANHYGDWAVGVWPGLGDGITVHEEPFLDTVNQTVLQANMTFTVEPSVRIPGRLSNRVEDVVRVTKDGAVSLYDTGQQLHVVD